MNSRTLLALPEAPAPRSLTVEALRDLVERGIGALETHPRLGRQFLRLASVPGQRRAALALIYHAADSESKPLIRTLRHLAQLLCDAEAHEARQPGKARAVTVSHSNAAAVAASAALPLSLS